MTSVETFSTKYGIISLYSNEAFIINDFRRNRYWDENTLLKLKKYIDPKRNILEVGGHCGTSTIVYASFINDTQTLNVFEPQQNMFKLLQRNVQQNNLQNKIIPHNKGVFCYSGSAKMNSRDLELGAVAAKSYTKGNTTKCNFGGMCLGAGGETIHLTTIDDLKLDNIGFIHCDAQGSENFIFARATETIRRCRPVVYYEDNERLGKYLYDKVCKTHCPKYRQESKFDIAKYCMETLGYSKMIRRFNGGIDTLLVP